MRPVYLAVALLTAPSAARAAGATGAGTLRRPLSARMVAMSEAYGALPAGLSSLGANPAGLVAEKKLALESTLARGLIDDSFSFLGVAAPTRLGVLAVGAAYYDGGKIDLKFADGSNSVRSAQRDMVGMLSFAREVGAGVSLGLTAKFYRFELAQEARASGMAADAGAQWHAPVRGLVLGAAVQNAGKGVRYEQETDPLPLALRGGASWTWAMKAGQEEASSYYEGLRTIFSAEALKARDEKVAGLLGVEFALDFKNLSSIALRAGHAFNRDVNGISIGAGVRERRYSLDYAFDSRGTLGNAHQVTLGARF